MSRSRTALAVTIMLLSVAFAVGCGTAPTSPTATATAVSPAARSAAPASLLPSPLTQPVLDLLWKSVSIIGSLGGSLTDGLWRVNIPPGAIDGFATVSIGVPSLTATGCKLEINPVSANHFNQPVTLTIDCSTVPASELASWSIYWYNPGTGIWERVPGSTVDLTRKTVSAPLWHFSTYGAGPTASKAGW